MPYFCIAADSSIVWAFSWGAKAVMEISSESVLHMEGGLGFVQLFLETLWSRLSSDLQTRLSVSLLNFSGNMLSHTQAAQRQ